MDTERFLSLLRDQKEYQNQIVHIEKLPARSAQYGVLNEPLHFELQDALEKNEIRSLYSHQAEAVNAVREGKNVTVITSTASGKTLCYNLPVIDAILTDPKSTALYIFPTKALAHDQMSKIDEFGLFPRVRHATFDGDTSSVDRPYIKKMAQIVLTNPDMLHMGIFPGHGSWSKFLGQLKFVVIDEMHMYRGVFGAHMAQIIRRLRRICAIYGSRPQFLCCSATIANPKELTESLTGIPDPVVVNNNGAPCGKKTMVFWNPPTADASSGNRRSANGEATSLLVGLTIFGARNITFTRARRTAEIVLKYARTLLGETSPHLISRIASYRSGYTVKERRQIEERLFSGKLLGITATNALELGVDISGIDAVVLTGYPGTIAATWQQAGRAGRSGQESLAILVAQDNPLDQFLMRYPEFFFDQSHEMSIIDPNNKKIISSHLLCAAYEAPLKKEDMELFGEVSSRMARQLRNEGKLVLRGDRLFYGEHGYPASGVNIRSASNSIYRIMDISEKDFMLGTMESQTAFKLLHPGAIYLHNGESYEVKQLNIDSLEATVQPVDANFYTEASEQAEISILSCLHSVQNNNLVCSFGEVEVSSHVVSFQKKRYYSGEVIETQLLSLPPNIFETEAFWLEIPQQLQDQLANAGAVLAGSIHAVEHTIINMLPLLATCDRNDLGGLSQIYHPDTHLPTIFIYDAYPGGVGIAETIFARMEGMLTAALALITGCKCAEGCPACIQSSSCGFGNQPLDKRGGMLLLQWLLGVLSDEPQK